MLEVGNSASIIEIYYNGIKVDMSYDYFTIKEQRTGESRDFWDFDLQRPRNVFFPGPTHYMFILSRARIPDWLITLLRDHTPIFCIKYAGESFSVHCSRWEIGNEVSELTFVG